MSKRKQRQLRSRSKKSQRTAESLGRLDPQSCPEGGPESDLPLCFALNPCWPEVQLYLEQLNPGYRALFDTKSCAQCEEFLSSDDFWARVKDGVTPQAAADAVLCHEPRYQRRGAQAPSYLAIVRAAEFNRPPEPIDCALEAPGWGEDAALVERILAAHESKAAHDCGATH